jgi:single-strand DNA-binding protein
MSISKAILIGRLGRDAETVTFSDGRKVVNLNVAADSRAWKDKESGERKTKTNWHRVVINNKNLVEWTGTLKKGARVYVEGLLEEREYEKDGQKRHIWEVIVTAFDGSIIHTDKKEGGGAKDRDVPTDEGAMSEMPY